MYLTHEQVAGLHRVTL